GWNVSFSVSASGSPPLSYFWRRNGSPISGATASSYSTNNVQLSDSGAQFSCVVSNAYGTLLSSNAVLTVSNRIVIGYFTDQNPGATGAAVPILRNSAIPAQISDISTFNFGSISILLLNEGASSGLS